MANTDHKSQNLKFSEPACYRICVKGFLDESWSSRFGGMQIGNQVPDALTPSAVIIGEVRDQTDLLGVLNNLYEMHLPLISVDLIELKDISTSKMQNNS